MNTIRNRKIFVKRQKPIYDLFWEYIKSMDLITVRTDDFSVLINLRNISKVHR